LVKSAVEEALKMLEKRLVPEKVLLSARRVEEAAVIVPLEPKEILVPLTVTEELARSVLATVAHVAIPRDESERMN
jgi:hypothetical protein